jgi:hypothetical protein
VNFWMTSILDVLAACILMLPLVLFIGLVVVALWFHPGMLVVIAAVAAMVWAYHRLGSK